MKHITFYALYIITIPVASIFAQNFDENYSNQIKFADSLYHLSQYKKAALIYNKAFKDNGNLGYVPDRYSAAGAWAMANEPDSAFIHLFRIIERAKFAELVKVENDSLFLNLHSQPRWTMAINMIKKNKQEKEELIAILEIVFEDDQRFRSKVEETQQRFGRGSIEMKELDDLISRADSVNEIKVKKILDKYGWPGQHIIGPRGITIFLVLQHSDLPVQEKYLPQVKAAAHAGELDADKLALFEDRIAVKRGECQIYGTQIGFDDKSQQHYIFPVVDPEQVDDRRKQIGLGPLSEYVEHWKIKWNPTQYKVQITKLLGKKINCYQY